MPHSPEFAELARQAIEAQESEEQTEGIEPEVQDLDTEETEDPEAEETEGTESEETEEVETDEEAEAGDDEVPTHYYGMDLSEFPPEVRQSIIEEAKAQDKHINSLQRESAEKDGELAELRQAVTTLAETVKQLQAGAETPTAEPTDEDYFEMLGLDPDDEVDQLLGQKMLPVVKRLTQMEAQLQQQQEADNTASFEAWADHWNSTLDKLEQDQGPLPIDREQLIDHCLKHGIVDPEAAYKSVTEPMRKAAIDAALKAKSEALRAEKKKASPPRPRGSGNTSTAVPEDMSVRDALALAEEQTGISLASALAED